MSICTKHFTYIILCALYHNPCLWYYSYSQQTNEKQEALKGEVRKLAPVLNNSCISWDLNAVLSSFSTPVPNPYTLPLSLWSKTVKGNTLHRGSEQKIAVRKSQLWQSCGETSTFLGKGKLCGIFSRRIWESSTMSAIELLPLWPREDTHFFSVVKPGTWPAVFQPCGPGSAFLLFEPHLTQLQDKTKQKNNSSSISEGFCKD